MWKSRIGGKQIQEAYVQTDRGLKRVVDFYSVTENGLRRWEPQESGIFQFEIDGDYCFFNASGEIMVDWGDGTTDRYRGAHIYASHMYAVPSRCVVTITGNLTGFYIKKTNTSFKAITGVVTVFPRTMRQATDFSYCFSGCNKLTSIPAGLFDNCPQVTSFYRCFYGCTSLIGEAPPLWEMFPNADGTGCFYGCTRLSNYNKIPARWKSEWR